MAKGDSRAVTKGPDTDSDNAGLETMLCFAVYGAAHAFTRAYKPLLEPLGLTYPQYIVMRALWSEQGLTVKTLSDRLGLDSGTLSPLLKRLERAGLLQRKRDINDERQVIISLTAAGSGLQERLAGIKAAISEATGCRREDVAGLREALKELTKSLERSIA